MSERPLLRIVRGNPDDAELAALTAVVAAAASAPRGEPAEPPRRSWWSDRSKLLGCPVRPGDGAWRASSLPR
ncbi:acyl-CoA carboxylase subunit epsilon [Amycolatopsis taiwanensis]|uniref:Acetyl-CoA carboxylase biotin carboxyl carrier protein subunit n=1 Tax=Amycolatopsis taiwanensis TaxID=342230 RepID=A0A9W6VIH2_9PSEU|nr:acyl-CoA carboxylase subunit epsilon [Amycolatopsis taiwanensis]GLY68439.1 acetyl-CoA carboxylase biotin carboxyl carrier protein subunit [Amycolatopsis taiwanensis]